MFSIFNFQFSAISGIQTDPKSKTQAGQNLFGFINHAGPFPIQPCHSTYGCDHVNKVRIPMREPRNRK